MTKNIDDVLIKFAAKSATFGPNLVYSKENMDTAKQALYSDLLELAEVSGMSLVEDNKWKKDLCIPVDRLKEYFNL